MVEWCTRGIGIIYRLGSDEEVAKPALSGSLCEVVWQGTVQARSFPAFRFQVRFFFFLFPLLFLSSAPLAPILHYD